MTKSTVVIDQEAKKTFETNLNAFKLYNPHLYEPLRTHKPRARIVAGDDGTLDVLDGERSLYGGDAVAFVRDRLAAFDANPTHLATTAPEPGNFDRYANPFVGGLMRDARTNGISFHNGLPASEPFNLFIFGVGLGFHILPLLERYSPTFTVIIEQNLDNLYHSLFTFDWATALAQAFKEGGGMYVTVETEATLTIANINHVISENCPAGLDGTPCFIFSDEEYANAILQQVLANGPLLLAGLGYLFDETKMMRNTYVNLRGKDGKVIVRSEAPSLETPVFVVGAGPSLDHDLDVIRKWQDRAIIISTGTAIRSLLVNGIRPDFHVEMENMHVYSSIKPLSEEYDLSGICLVVSTSIEPHIVSFFDDVLFYFRQWTSPYPLFCDTPLHGLRKPGPLVVNVSFSLALDIGARSIFMFGTDFGTRGEGLDHAKDNVLFTEGAVIGFTQTYDQKVAPNFDGDFFASYDFLWGLKAIRETIQLFGHGCRIANCSDGALVEGTLPLCSSEVRLDTSPETKQRDLAAVKSGSKDISAAWFDRHWDPDALRAEINRFVDEAVSIFGDPKSYDDNVYLKRFMRLSRDIPLNRKDPGSDQYARISLAVADLFRGSIDMFLICIRYYLGRVTPAGKRAAFVAAIAAGIQEQLELMRASALDVIDHPENILPAKESGAWGGDDVIEETSYTWGKVSRNEPCPCGSGKRFKHCHGAG
ncbi:MAG: DUF115 domain-containing protein [Rhodospirillales bacterium]|nr:DUF115 domain-containing protein [Rhodospirillales bacterium]